MLTRRRFALLGASLCIAGVVGCSDNRDATDLAEGGIGPAGKPSTEPQLSPNEEYERAQKEQAEADKQAKSNRK